MELPTEKRTDDLGKVKGNMNPTRDVSWNNESDYKTPSGKEIQYGCGKIYWRFLVKWI